MLPFIKKTLDRLEKLDVRDIRSIILALSDEQQRLAEVVNSLPDGIVVLNEYHYVLLQNRAAQLLLPMRNRTGSERVLDNIEVWHTIQDAHPARYLQQELERLARERSASPPFLFETADNARTLQMEILPLVRKGRVVGNILRITDITEKISNESRLHRAEQMASLTHLTANVAHEIKNPLGAISIHIQLLKRELEWGVSGASLPTIHNHVQVVEEEISRLNTTVVNFLFSVRPMDLNLEEVDIHSVLDEVIVLFRPEMQQAQIRLTTRYHNNLPRVEVDATYMKQALGNVIKNAIESIALMEEGSARRRRKRIEICTHAPTGHGDCAVRVEIIDTGVGIQEEQMKRIFDPYFTTKDTGSGIGLMQADKIIREHRGEITVENNKSVRGATVTILLPPSRMRQKLIGAGNVQHTNSR